MLEFQQKRKVKRIFHSKITILILLLVLFFVGRGVWKIYQKQVVTKENLEKVTDSLAKLQERESRLSSEITWLQTQAGTEAEIRERYGLIKPNEEVIVVIDRGNYDINLDKYLPTKSWWQKMIDMLR